MSQDQFFWVLFSFILTIMVFSYLLGDNPLFRIATYLFIGVSAAYVFVIILYQIIIPKVIIPLFDGENNQKFMLAIPLLLSILLFFRLSSKTNFLGAIPLAFIVGSGAAIILTSSFSGTLIPMVDLISEPFSIKDTDFQKFIGGIILLIGTISTLLYFQNTKNKSFESNHIFSTILRYSNVIGIVFIGITLGSIFAGVIISSSFALIERLNFIITFIYNLISG